MADNEPVAEAETTAAGVNEGTGSAPATSGLGDATAAEKTAPPEAGEDTVPAPAEATPPVSVVAKAASSKAASGSASGRSGKAPAPPGDAPRTTKRKVREGTVVSNGMEKTAVVVVFERVRHPRYAKTVQRTKRLYAHDETNDVRVGDRVRLIETRPLSKLKRWRVERVLERAR
jgi:small subunit ribosomal protein S17